MYINTNVQQLNYPPLDLFSMGKVNSSFQLIIEIRNFSTYLKIIATNAVYKKSKS